MGIVAGAIMQVAWNEAREVDALPELSDSCHNFLNAIDFERQLESTAAELQMMLLNRGLPLLKLEVADASATICVLLVKAEKRQTALNRQCLMAFVIDNLIYLPHEQRVQLQL